jgi:hypothetical protein
VPAPAFGIARKNSRRSTEQEIPVREVVGSRESKVLEVDRERAGDTGVEVELVDVTDEPVREFKRAAA